MTAFLAYLVAVILVGRWTTASYRHHLFTGRPHEAAHRPRPPRPHLAAPMTTHTTADASARPTASQITDNQLDALYSRLDAARALHQPMQRGCRTICAHCSGWNGFRCIGAVQEYPCPTVRAIDTPNEDQS